MKFLKTYKLTIQIFSKFGQVKHVRITNRGNSHGGSNSAGFGFVTFQRESEARNALESKEGIYYNNLQLNVEEKKTRVCNFFENYHFSEHHHFSANCL